MKPRATRLGGNAVLAVPSVTLSPVLLEFLVRAFFSSYDPSGNVKFIQLADGPVFDPTH
jgi:hypothetical protein